jgi:acyl-CoA reductase-like NAD-dependent aldehyde dehydrogenase
MNATTSRPMIEVRDPADDTRVVGEVPALDRDEALRLLDRAAAAQPGWRALGAPGRGRVLLDAAARLRRDAESLAALISSEMGKTLAEARAEAASAADFFEFFGGLGRAPIGEVLPDARPGVHTIAVREPLGVILAITPWNDPLVTPARKLAPALISGNAVLIKPPLETPLVCVRLRELLIEAGLPDDVLAVLTGEVAEVVEPVFDDARLSGVSFTGSTATGALIRARLASRNLPLQTEMGGKNATVVCADADLDLAAETITSAAFGQAGQRCTATSRVIVDAAVDEPLLAKLRDRMGALVVGPGSDTGTDVGPLVSERALRGVMGHIDGAIRDGAEAVLGGARPSDPKLSRGWFVDPTLLGKVTTTMPIWRDEVFGPVLAVISEDDFDAMIEAVNDSAYGLSAAIFTRDLSRAHRFAAAVDTGQVAINLPTGGWPAHLPFGGFGDSGSAHKEQGAQALNFYTRLKTVAMRYAG